MPNLFDFLSGDRDQIRNCLLSRDQDALDELMINFALRDVDPNEVEQVAYAELVALPAEVRQWWEAPCTLPGCNEH